MSDPNLAAALHKRSDAPSLQVGHAASLTFVGWFDRLVSSLEPAGVEPAEAKTGAVGVIAGFLGSVEAGARAMAIAVGASALSTADATRD